VAASAPPTPKQYAAEEKNAGSLHATLYSNTGISEPPATPFPHILKGMLKNTDDVISSIEAGTISEHLHQNLELKEQWDQKHGNKLSALANKLDQISCLLVVGVSDTGKVVGKDEKWAKQTEENISQHINKLLDPIQACKKIECRDTGRGWIVVITIQNSGEVTYWGDHSYVAAGTTTKQMTPEEVLQLRIQLPGLTDYSKQYHKSTYNKSIIQRFSSEVAKKSTLLEKSGEGDDPEECLRTLGLFERQAARLLFGKASYRVVTFDEEEEPTSNEKHEGLLSLLLPESIQAICHKDGNHFSEKALKEALANAVAHSAYFESDGDIIIEIHPNRIVVANLCLQESTYFANRWFSRSHKTVNGLLMETLRVAGYVDELGRGKNLIFSESIRNGRRAPEVHIENAGKYQRWKLTIYGGKEDEKLIRLLNRCREIFQDEKKSLIALALVLWHERPVKEIRQFVDGDFDRQFAEVLTHLNGPLLYRGDDQQIIMRRWVKVLLGEGKDSKALSSAEEESLRQAAYDIQMKYKGGEITPFELRRLASMGNTKSEITLSSVILRRWCDEGIVTKKGRGKYQFVAKPKNIEISYEEILKLFKR